MPADLHKRPVVTLFCGLPGAGKTTRARELERDTGAIRFSTDEWMAALGLDFFAPLRDRLQARLDELSKELVERGLSVILEDGTWKRTERDSLREFAMSHDADIEIHHFDISADELWRRLEARNANLPPGVAPISRDVFEESLSRFEMPGDDELALFDRQILHRE